MTSRIRRALISLAFAPWVSAAPAIQHSDLPLVKSFPEPCALTHSIPEIIDRVTLTSPVYIIVGGAEYTMDARIERDAERSLISPALQTLSNTITIKYDTQSCEPYATNLLSVDVGGTAFNLSFLSEELGSAVVNNECAHHLTRFLDACGQYLVESMKVVASNDLLLEGEVLVKGKTKSKTDEVIDKNVKDLIGENGASNVKRDRHGNNNVDVAGEDEGGSPDVDGGLEEEEEERELIPPPDRNLWSLTAILLMTSSMLIAAARLFYVRWRRLVRSYRKPHRFCVGEATLLRWASEDMIFNDEELDTMVNENEEIPLNPSPTKGFIIQYGSNT